MISLIRIGVIILNAVWLGWACWRAGNTKHPGRWRLAALAWYAFIMGFYFWLGYVRFNVTDMTIPAVPLGIVYIWALLVLGPLVLSIVVVEGCIGIRALTRRLGERRRPLIDTTDDRVVSAGEHSVSRREFLWTTAVVAPPALTVICGLGGYAQSQRFRVRRLSIDVPRLPKELDGVAIAHVSDVHAGKFVDDVHLRRISDAVNELRADLVLATGDLIDFALADLPRALEAVRRMEAPGGVFMCEGNHDLFQSREQFERQAREADVGLLINETATVKLRGHDVQLIGLRWALEDGVDPRPVYLQRIESTADGFTPATELDNTGNEQWQPWRDDAGAMAHLDRLRSDIDGDAFGIVLAHHPHAFDAAAEFGIPLTLAGHTHGGQLMLSKNVGGPMMYRYWSGLYKKGNSRLVVSNGVGNWLPLRINAPAELIHITLHRT